MLLSNDSIETLIDLVEIKLSVVEIYDSEDSSSVNNLKKCRDELCALISKAPRGKTISFDSQVLA